MPGDSINVEGSWVTVQAAASTTDGAMSAGARTDIVTALGTTEAAYNFLDFEALISAGTPIENGTIDVYRRSKADGTNESPSPTTTFLSEYVCSIKLDDTASSQFYRYFNANPDINATYYALNNGGATLTVALKARGRTYNLN